MGFTCLSGPIPEFSFSFLIVVFYPAFAWLYTNYHYTYEMLRRFIVEQDGKLPQPPLEADMGDLICYLQSGDSNHLFEELEAYLQKEQPYLDYNFKRGDLIKALGTNERNLSAAVGRATGLTLQNYLLRLRIRHAMDLLLLRTTRTTQSKTLPERRASRQCAPSTAISANW